MDFCNEFDSHLVLKTPYERAIEFNTLHRVLES